MKSKEIDLRYVSVSCTSHPVIKLGNALAGLASEDIDEIRILFRSDDIPEEAMKLFLSKYGYVVEDIKNIDDRSSLLIARKRT